MAAVLKYRLAAQPSYRQGEPVTITFTLENVSSQHVWVLTWYTPLEGLKGKIFRIVCNGASIPYQGRMVKRGDPDPDDYFPLPPGASVSADVDLSKAYPLPPGLKCTLTFNGEIQDVVFGEKLVVRSPAEHQPVKVSGNAVTLSLVS